MGQKIAELRGVGHYSYGDQALITDFGMIIIIQDLTVSQPGTHDKWVGVWEKKFDVFFVDKDLTKIRSLGRYALRLSLDSQNGKLVEVWKEYVDQKLLENGVFTIVVKGGPQSEDMKESIEFRLYPAKAQVA